MTTDSALFPLFLVGVLFHIFAIIAAVLGMIYG